ncbi:hypothetical protein DVH24_036089 [Malus domestica]|uniref:RNase H type-1 domain-containing protein n=1 Tax=Malus domestica TaxID=3750 RepID=A0A498IDM0_MALDO|nr:hypothetical protein DVH24_036089 [Malus domestica]
MKQFYTFSRTAHLLDALGYLPPWASYYAVLTPNLICFRLWELKTKSRLTTLTPSWLFDGRCDSPDIIVARGFQWWQSFIQLNATLPPTSVTPPKIYKWSPPPAALSDPSTNLSIVGQVVEDIKATLPSITEASFTHVHHQANSAAHRLARLDLSLNQDCEWFDSPPSIILDLLVKESHVP